MKNRRWDLVHKFEDEYRRRYLKRLSAEESFKIMEDLYDFAVMVDKKSVEKAHKEHLKHLVKMHAFFNKLDSRPRAFCIRGR